MLYDIIIIIAKLHIVERNRRISMWSIVVNASVLCSLQIVTIRSWLTSYLSSNFNWLPKSLLKYVNIRGSRERRAHPTKPDVCISRLPLIVYVGGRIGHGTAVFVLRPIWTHTHAQHTHTHTQYTHTRIASRAVALDTARAVGGFYITTYIIHLGCMWELNYLS